MVVRLALAMALGERVNTRIVIGALLIDVGRHLPPVEPIWIQVARKQLTIL